MALEDKKLELSLICILGKIEGGKLTTAERQAIAAKIDTNVSDYLKINVQINAQNNEIKGNKEDGSGMRPK